MSASLSSQARSVSALSSLYMVRMLGLFMVLPVLSLASEDYLGSNVFLLGVALGIYGLTQACLQIPFGILSDRFGRKPLIILGLILFGSGSVIAASAQTIEGLILGRALQGTGAIAGVIMAMVGDLTSDENRSKAMASIGASIGVAFALSLIVGPFISSMGGVRLIFWLTVGLTFLGILIVLFVIPNVPEETQKSTLSIQGLKNISANPHLWRLNVGVFVLHTVLMSIFVGLPLLLMKVGIPESKHALVYLVVMFISFVIMIPLMIIGEKRKKVKPIFLTILALAAFSLILLSFSVSSMVWVLIAILLFFIAFNYLEATLPSLMTKTVSASNRGAGSGLFATCQFLGAAVGGILGGWLYSRFGLSLMLISAALLIVLWWLFAFSMVIPVTKSIETKNVIA